MGCNQSSKMRKISCRNGHTILLANMNLGSTTCEISVAVMAYKHSAAAGKNNFRDRLECGAG